MTVLEAASFLASHARQTVFAPGEWCQLAIADIRTDVLIGDMGVLISPDRSRAEFGLSITPGVQGTGYGSESTRGLIDLLFSATPVVEVMASTDIRNAACLRVLGRAGMRHVETRQVECKGESCVEHVFSISREGAGRRRLMHVRDTLDLKAVSPLDVLGRYRGRFSAACTDPMRVGIRGLIPGVGEPMKRMAICLLAVLSWSEARASGPLEIVFYDVHGTDQRELRESMDSHGPVGVDGERHHGYTRWHVGWAFELVSSPSRCRVRSVETTLKVTMTLPRWNRPDEVPEDLEREWRRYSDALREHEEGHHEIAMSAADEVRRQLTGVSSTSGCQVLAEDLDRRAKAVIETFNARELEYDAATDHGSTQGARF